MISLGSGYRHVLSLVSVVKTRWREGEGVRGFERMGLEEIRGGQRISIEWWVG